MRCILLVLDSVGVGELPDASEYGDQGSNTLGNIAKTVKNLDLPVLQMLGLANITPLEGIEPAKRPQAAFGKCAELSAGKDTMTGHWELMGIKLDKAFPAYPQGFPEEIVNRFEELIGQKVLGNKAASGTEIIEEIGEEHLRTGFPIIYTSADSVFQIAAHKERISLDRLYEMCEIARNMLSGKHNVARVIARPFIGVPGSFKRTDERKDYTVQPPLNVLDSLLKSGIEVVGIGKIAEIFAHRGISKDIHASGNEELMGLTIREFLQLKRGLIFTNLVDFDMLWGHRNNVDGYAKALESFDKKLSQLIPMLTKDDLLIITADHGCDPTTESTDHSREYVPLLLTGPSVIAGVNLETRQTFADIGQTIADFFNVPKAGIGKSFFKVIWKS